MYLQFAVFRIVLQQRGCINSRGSLLMGTTMHNSTSDAWQPLQFRLRTILLFTSALSLVLAGAAQAGFAGGMSAGLLLCLWTLIWLDSAMPRSFRWAQILAFTASLCVMPVFGVLVSGSLFVALAIASLIFRVGCTWPTIRLSAFARPAAILAASIVVLPCFAIAFEGLAFRLGYDEGVARARAAINDGSAQYLAQQKGYVRWCIVPAFSIKHARWSGERAGFFETLPPGAGDAEHAVKLLQARGATFPSAAGSAAEITSIQLPQDSVTDQDLQYLQLFPLYKLSLTGQRNVTDEGVEYLKHMRFLRSLDIRDTRITAKGVNKLKQAMPSCRIRYESKPVGEGPGFVAAT